MKRDRTSEALERALAARCEAELRTLAELPPHVLAHPHLAWVRRRLDPGRDVDAVAVQISVPGRRHVADVNADPELPRAEAFGVDHPREVGPQRVRRTHRLLG